MLFAVAVVVIVLTDQLFNEVLCKKRRTPVCEDKLHLWEKTQSGGCPEAEEQL